MGEIEGNIVGVGYDRRVHTDISHGQSFQVLCESTRTRKGLVVSGWLLSSLSMAIRFLVLQLVCHFFFAPLFLRHPYRIQLHSLLLIITAVMSPSFVASCPVIASSRNNCPVGDLA